MYTDGLLILLFIAGIINLIILYIMIGSATKSKLVTLWLQQIARNNEIQSKILIEIYKLNGGNEKKIIEILKSSEEKSYSPKFRSSYKPDLKAQEPEQNAIK